MSEAWHLAIDFGTSNSAAAHTAPGSGSVETLALTHRSNLIPSAVYVDGNDTGGSTVLTGDTALHAGRRDPLRLILSPKRFIDHETVQLGGDDIEARQVIGAVLNSVVQRAVEQHAGTAPASVTLTHPEQWSAHALGNLVDAARAQDWARDVDVRVISEPRAAAIHYAAQQNVAPGDHVAVYDFGGGTLDVAVLRAEASGDYRVVAARGDNSLGGRTIDNLVYRWLIEQVEHDDPDLADSLRSAPVSVMNAMEENIRQAKEMLSDTSSATITISTPSGDRDVLITRAQFNEIIAQPIERAREMTQAVLREAGVEGESTGIYLTGGSSRIPYVHEQLAQVGRVVRLDDPKTVVARGALVATMRGFSAPAAGAAGGAGRPRGGDSSNPFGAAAAGAAGAGAAGAAGAAAGSAWGTAPASGDTGTSPFDQQPPRAQQDVPPAEAPAPQPQTAPTPDPTPSSLSSGNTNNTGKSGGSKLPLAIGAGVVALLVGGGILAWSTGLFGGDDDENDGGNGGGGGNQTTAASPDPAEPDNDTDNDTGTTAGSDGPFLSASETSGQYLPVTEMIPGSDAYLPEDFTERVARCAVDNSDVAEFGFPWSGDARYAARYCTIDSESENPVHSDKTPLSPSLYGGDDAVEIMEPLEASDDVTLTEVDSGDGEVYYIETEGALANRAVVWYPDEELLVHFLLATGDEQSEAEEYLSYYGFI